MLWADKYRPKDFLSLDYHKDQAKCLKNLTTDNDFPHLLIYGPLGAGKKTRIMCLLRELYGPGVDRLKSETLTFTTASHKKVEINTISSNYHIEVSPSDVGINDRVVIMDIIKNMAQTQQLNSANQRSFKIILLTDVESLTKDAQHALRRTMEKYVSNCRIILCTTSISKVIPAIKSRCLCLRIAAPSNEEVTNVLKNVCTKERFKLSDSLLKNIVTKSNRNLRQALLMCESLKSLPEGISPQTQVVDADWAVSIKNLVSSVWKNQSIATLSRAREALYELIIFGIPSEMIFRHAVKEFLQVCDEDMARKIVHFGAHYEYAACQGSKEIFHLEAFIANCMCAYQKMMQDFMECEF